MRRGCHVAPIEPTATDFPIPANRLTTYWELARPFTLLMPAIGMASSGLVAWGATIEGIAGGGRFESPFAPDTTGLVLRLLMGAILAATLNAASNALNQIYDLEADRVNKPSRPLPEGRLTVRRTWAFVWVNYLLSLVLAFALGPVCGILVSLGAVCTWIYSVPPLRTKQHYISANLTIATARGMLLKVAGWSAIKPVLHPEPWLLGSVFFLFLLGATSIKDFADVEGDQLNGCRTLPIVFGFDGAIARMAPFYTLPFLILPLGVTTGIITGNAVLLAVLTGVLVVWGTVTIRSLKQQQDFSSAGSNHPAWKHMYLMMLLLQGGTAAAYLI